MSSLFVWLKRQGYCFQDQRALQEKFPGCEFTHTSLQGGSMGVLHIPSNDHQTFLEKYSEDLNRKLDFFFSEKSTPIFPFFVDIDFHLTDRFEAPGAKELEQISSSIQKAVESCFTQRRPEPDYEEDDDEEWLQAEEFFLIACARQRDPSNNSFGIHIHFPNLMVDSARSLRLRQKIIEALHSLSILEPLRDPDNPSSLSYLETIVDRGVYATGCIRMVGSSKCQHCPECRSKRAAPGEDGEDEEEDACRTCRGQGVINLGRVYLPTLVLDSRGRPSPVLLDRLRGNIGQAVLLCSVRRFQVRLTQGWSERENLLVIVPPVQAPVVTTTNKRRPTGAPSETPASKKSKDSRENFPPTHPIFIAIRDAIPQVVNFDPCQSGLIVKSVTRFNAGFTCNVTSRNGSHKWCLHVKRFHTQRTVWFYVGPKGIVLKCNSAKNNCASFRSPTIPLPGNLKQILFPPPITHDVAHNIASTPISCSIPSYADDNTRKNYIEAFEAKLELFAKNVRTLRQPVEVEIEEEEEEY